MTIGAPSKLTSRGARSRPVHDAELLDLSKAERRGLRRRRLMSGRQMTKALKRAQRRRAAA